MRFVKVAEYQHRGIIHYHTVIHLDAPGEGHQPPPPRHTHPATRTRTSKPAVMH